MLSTYEKTQHRWWDHYIAIVAEFPKTIKSPLTLPRIFKLKDEIWADDDFWAELVAMGIEQAPPEDVWHDNSFFYDAIIESFTAGLLAAYNRVPPTQEDFLAMMAVAND